MNALFAVVKKLKKKEQTMNQNSELLPCPFCGKRGETDQFNEDGGNWQGLCEDLECRGGVPLDEGYSTQEKAINAWNTRPTPQVSDSELVKRLKVLTDENNIRCYMGDSVIEQTLKDCLQTIDHKEE